jgi:hypothetical protein
VKNNEGHSIWDKFLRGLIGVIGKEIDEVKLKNEHVNSQIIKKLIVSVDDLIKEVEYEL